MNTVVLDGHVVVEELLESEGKAWLNFLKWKKSWGTDIIFNVKETYYVSSVLSFLTCLSTACMCSSLHTFGNAQPTELPRKHRSDVTLAQPLKMAGDRYPGAAWPKMTIAGGETGQCSAEVKVNIVRLKAVTAFFFFFGEKRFKPYEWKVTIIRNSVIYGRLQLLAFLLDNISCKWMWGNNINKGTWKK